MCGTPDYLAPEIILNKGHNHAVDYWALGVLVYEMIHGWPPFYHDSPMKVYEKIIMGKVDYPATFSKALEDIVSKFLVKNPSKRLGNVKGGISDITKHKWFGSFDWRGLMAGTLLAPVMPNLSAFDAAVAAGAEDEEEEENNEADQEQHQVRLSVRPPARLRVSSAAADPSLVCCPPHRRATGCPSCCSRRRAL